MLTHDRKPASRSLILRVARRIHEKVLDVARHTPMAAFPQSTWDEVQQLLRKVDKARRRRWLAAAEAEESIARMKLHSLIRQLHDWSAGREHLLNRVDYCSSLRDIDSDLLALEDEFDDVRIETVQRAVIVRTEPIELEDVCFGPFDIMLEWGRLGDSNPYRCLAVEPLRCAADDTLTHPHVQEHVLCAGDGKVPIAQALARGDLLGFFTLVRQVLRNYDEASAYKSISDWFGGDCPGCGGSLDSDNRRSCDVCQADICDECYDCCVNCEEYLCNDCSYRCHDCEEPVCLHCSRAIAPDDARLCPSCAEERAEADETDTSTTEEPHEELETTEAAPAASGTEAEAETLTRCVGQAAVPA